MRLAPIGKDYPIFTYILFTNISLTGLKLLTSCVRRKVFPKLQVDGTRMWPQAHRSSLKPFKIARTKGNEHKYIQIQTTSNNAKAKRGD